MGDLDVHRLGPAAEHAIELVGAVGHLARAIALAVVGLLAGDGGAVRRPRPGRWARRRPARARQHRAGRLAAGRGRRRVRRVRPVLLGRRGHPTGLIGLYPRILRLTLESASEGDSRHAIAFASRFYDPGKIRRYRAMHGSGAQPVRPRRRAAAAGAGRAGPRGRRVRDRAGAGRPRPPGAQPGAHRAARGGQDGAARRAAVDGRAGRLGRRQDRGPAGGRPAPAAVGRAAPGHPRSRRAAPRAGPDRRGAGRAQGVRAARRAGRGQAARTLAARHRRAAEERPRRLRGHRDRPGRAVHRGRRAGRRRRAPGWPS